MASKEESAQKGLYAGDTEQAQKTRILPIIQYPTSRGSPQSPVDPMDVVPRSESIMGPPARGTPEDDSNGAREHSSAAGEPHQSGNTLGPSAAAAAQAGSQQPKVVQTAFIHKLYNMLEDQSIQHLISWSNSAESFVMSPSNDFSKVLSQYFKHTNISSFVRQLNMYGFHKVSDVFHTGSPDSTLWEFKHGNGNFKRGDLVGLREIKRRASRHALVHRDSYPAVKPPPYTQPGTPAEPIQPIQESAETRLSHIEHTLYELHGRLAQRDDQLQYMSSRNQTLNEALSRTLQLNHDMSRALLAVVGTPESPLHRNILEIQGEFSRIQEMLRPLEEPQDGGYPGSRPLFSNLSLEGPPVSPRQMAQDDLRRQQPPMMGQPMRQPVFRPPPHLSIQPRRYGSIGNSSAASPSSLRYQAQAPVPPPPPPPAHPLATAHSPPTNLSRRHTSADIRLDHNWRPTPSPFASGHTSTQWPSSPDRRSSIINEDQRIRDSFSSYSLQAASQGHNDSRPATPPYSNGNNASAESLGTWSWGNSRGDKFGGAGFGASGLMKDSSGPPTRRGSMAHILNPAETAERDEEHDADIREEDRKRKRLQ